MLPEDDVNEIFMRLQIKQLPNLDNLSELQYLYYMIGFFHFHNKDVEHKNDIFEKVYKDIIEIVQYFSFEIADLKMLLFDLDAGVRGLGGSKVAFNVKDLPSYKKSMDEKNKLSLSTVENETPEERRERHRKFFEELKEAFKNK